MLFHLLMGFEQLYIQQERRNSSFSGCNTEAGIGGTSARAPLELGISWQFSPLEVRFRISAL